MVGRPPRATRTYTHLPDPPLFRSLRLRSLRLRRRLACDTLVFLDLQFALHLGAHVVPAAAHASQQGAGGPRGTRQFLRRSAEHTSELQSLMRISYAVFCLTTKINTSTTYPPPATITTPTLHC